MSLLIDVRNIEEYEERHADGAIHLPLMAILYGNLGILDTVAKDEHIELYCHSGGRASRAEELLRERGFTNVVNRGGLEDVEKE
ncbi:MAG: rhodanese-like domain-containing protein [Candidatus Moranbacteria bacterium]|jgi:phage shock protein E|nr:rhodanese-like domain-containing protein [Candidatus Moranbacteria bacterium]